MVVIGTEEARIEEAERVLSDSDGQRAHGARVLVRHGRLDEGRTTTDASACGET
jgi:hypothetical protein